MFQTLRIIFTILSAICVAIVIPVGAFVGLTYSLVCAAAAFVFFIVMLYFKGKQEASNPDGTDVSPDFLAPQREKDQKTQEIDK